MKNQFRVLVAGDNNFYDYQLMHSKLNILLSQKDNVIIVSAMAKIGYTLCEKYSRFHNLSISYFPAHWDQLDISSIFKINEQIMKNADACVCFWDGKSTGTKHIIDTAETMKIPLRVINY